ncbi:hypothetical protein GCK32_002293 [Trichostrongylus colubriformis]|uniref:Uncharacterized protein n=1 Tax=Trichostrongylus colubriformis TaxID=6319 RepID=A0AAN8F743_TRICO
MKANAIELGKKVEYAAGAAKETFTQFIEEPRRRTEAEPSPEGSPHPGRWDHQHVPQESGGFGQLSEQWTQPSQPRATLPPVRKISREDEQALFQWELERQKLEAERLAKLQDHEVIVLAVILIFCC